MPSHIRIRFSSYPRTEARPDFTDSLIRVFSKHAAKVSTQSLPKGLTSDEVLATVAPDRRRLGFEVESGKSTKAKIERPVFFGENGEPDLR